MGKGFHGMSQRRRQKYATRVHARREAERRRLQAPAPPVVAHDPEHATGCLVCFVARVERRRTERSAR